MSAAQTVVFTDGVFDLFHANHLAVLEEAKTYGDKLVVGVTSDAMAASYKRAPVIAQQERLRIVQAISCVDEAFILDSPMGEEKMMEILDTYDVTSVVYAGDATPEFYRPAEAQGKMVHLPYHAGTSTSGILRKIRALPEEAL